MPAVVVDGLIYVPGGYMETARGASGQSFFEVYDPSSDDWSTLAEMPEPRHHHMAAGHDGSIYVFGGIADLGNATTIEANAWRYDPATNSWEELAPMPDRRASGGTAVIGDAIYVVGGIPTGTEVFRLDVPTGEWSLEPALTAPREHTAAIALDGAVFAIGGRWEGANLTSVEVLLPGADGWQAGPEMNEGRSGFGVAVWGGSITVAGGEELGGLTTLTSVEVLGESGWMLVEPLAVPLHGVALVAIEDWLYSVGGSRRAGAIANSGELYRRTP